MKGQSESNPEMLSIDNWLRKLRKKWSVVPGCGTVRVDTKMMMTMKDSELLETWINIRNSEISGERFAVRGWYHELYRPLFTGKTILDVGSGIGIDGLTFSQSGAKVTFMDIVESNLKIIDRLGTMLDLDINTVPITSEKSFKYLNETFDFIWCQGAMINMPFEVAKCEAFHILSLLKPNGRWIELAYPKERWTREGSLPFDKWGEYTDGKGTPWVEWYDLDKILQRLSSEKWNSVLHFNFHNNDFNWFDLKRL